MDDIYEFNNNQYRIASMQVKAVAYDIVTEITKKTMSLSIDKEMIEKNNIINSLTSIQNKLIEITDEFSKQLEDLDRFEQNTLGQTKKQPAEITSETKEIPKIEKPNTGHKIKSEEVSKEETTPDTTMEDINLADIKNDQEQPTASTEPATLEKQEYQKKRFQKTSKGLSKAIMVRKNQLINLKSSKASQEKILIDKGIFEEKEEKTEENSITPNTLPQKQLSDEIERQIEDLTVKANIYYNEGELDKAQELYNKIRELSNQK